MKHNVIAFGSAKKRGECNFRLGSPYVIANVDVHQGIIVDQIRLVMHTLNGRALHRRSRPAPRETFTVQPLILSIAKETNDR